MAINVIPFRWQPKPGIPHPLLLQRKAGSR